MIGGNQELDYYVRSATGISRKTLNIMCFIGIFIFGWLLAVVFDQLGKKSKGWLYVGPVFVMIIASNKGGQDLTPLALILYVIGWVHANRILTRYQLLSKVRVANIDDIPAENLTVDDILEKGLLQYKVLGQTDRALDTLSEVLSLEGGNPDYLNRAGVVFSFKQKFAEAKDFFERALPGITDEKLKKQIKVNIEAMDKALQKSKR